MKQNLFVSSRGKAWHKLHAHLSNALPLKMLTCQTALQLKKLLAEAL
jgi:hypothetical protein